MSFEVNTKVTKAKQKGTEANAKLFPSIFSVTFDVNFVPFVLTPAQLIQHGFHFGERMLVARALCTGNSILQHGAGFRCAS